MVIILYILGALFCLGIILVLLRFIGQLLLVAIGIALIIGVGFLIVAFFPWSLIILAILFTLGYFMDKSIDKKVKAYFYQYEMGTYTDIVNFIDSKDSANQVQDKLNDLVQKGVIERLDFNQNQIAYRCLEKRTYPKGVITHHISLD
ncbi:hypothetical protein CN907_11415 [Bacillus anthracis]|nr:hypothetical protein CN907_11415 [Bacillus anthracis]